MTRILVVEDTPSHMAKAKHIAAEMGIELVTATTGREGQQEVRGVDGVVTDIYMPEQDYPPFNIEGPVGILVGAVAMQYGIPFVFCTAGYHHGAKYNWIGSYCYTFEPPLVMFEGHSGDGVPYDHETPSKPWRHAFTCVLEMIEEKKQKS